MPSKAARAGLYNAPESEHGEANISSQPSSDSDDTVMNISGHTAWLLSKDNPFGLDPGEQPYRSFRQRMIERSLLLGVPLPLETGFESGLVAGSNSQQQSQDSFHGEYSTPNSQMSLDPDITPLETSTRGFCNSPEDSQAMSLCSTQQLSQGSYSSTQGSQAMSLCDRSQAWVTMADCDEPQTNDSPQPLTTLSRQESFSAMSETSIGTSFSATLAAFPLPPVTESGPSPPPIPPRPVTRAAKIKQMQEKLINATSKNSGEVFSLSVKPAVHNPLLSPDINTNDIKPPFYTETLRVGHHLPKACREPRVTKSNEYTAKTVSVKPRPVMVENVTDSDDDGTTDNDDERPASMMAGVSKRQYRIEGHDGKPQWSIAHSRNLRQGLQGSCTDSSKGGLCKKEVKRENSSPLLTQQTLNRETPKEQHQVHTNTPSFYSSLSLSQPKLPSLSSRSFQPQQSLASLPVCSHSTSNVRKRCRGNTALYLQSPSTFTPLIISANQTHRETLLKKNNEAMIELLRVDCRSRIQKYSAERIAYERSLKGATPATHGDSSHLLYLKGAGLAFVDETRRTVEAIKRICTEQLIILGKMEVEYLLGKWQGEVDPWASSTTYPPIVVGDDDDVFQSVSEDGGSPEGRRVRTKVENGMAPLGWNNAHKTELRLQKLSLRESGFGELELPGMKEADRNGVKEEDHGDTKGVQKVLEVVDDASDHDKHELATETSCSSQQRWIA